ncbi:MAG: hypothetical protein P8170_14870 [Gemmatimonadota bacterium]
MMTTISQPRRRPAPGSALAALATGFLVGVTAACASSPSSDPPDRAAPTRQVLRVGNASVEMYTQAGVGQSVVLAPTDKVWQVLPSVFEELEIPVTRLDPRVPEIGNPGYWARRIEGRRMGNYLDCGTNLSGQLANLYEIRLSVVTTLSAGPEGSTVVTTTVDAYGKPRTTSGNQVHCQSREALEKRVAELSAEKLGVIVG